MRKRIDIRKISIEVVVTILIVLWFYTGIAKLLGYRSFQLQMHQNRLLYRYADLITFGIPILEIAIGFLLVFGKTRRVGLLASSVLMVIFTVYVAYLMLYIPNLPCSCGGIISSLNWPQHLMLNIALTILAAAAFILSRKISRPDKLSFSNA